jgi:hypothetical protein
MLADRQYHPHMLTLALLLFFRIVPLSGQPIDLATLSLADAARLDGKSHEADC